MMQPEGTRIEGKSRRGFASMSPEKRREIARRGGKAAHEKGRAHEFTPEEAREAGRKGGLAVSLSREHMARIGRAGGQARRRRGTPVGEESHLDTGTVAREFSNVSFPAQKHELLAYVAERTLEIRAGETLILRDAISRLEGDSFESAEALAEAIRRGRDDASRAA